jgi:hypothetical protein
MKGTKKNPSGDGCIESIYNRSNSYLTEKKLLLNQFITIVLNTCKKIFHFKEKRRGRKDFHPSLYYRKRNTMGQFTIIPTEPYSAPPGPVIHPSSTKPKMANSSVSRERYPLSMAS